jgi:hypothetical protein
VNNSEEVWAFFKKFSLAAATGISRRASADARVSASCLNGIVRLKGIESNAGVRILDTRGRIVAASAAGRAEFDFRGMPGGVYQIIVDESKHTSALRIAIP